MRRERKAGDAKRLVIEVQEQNARRSLPAGVTTRRLAAAAAERPGCACECTMEVKLRKERERGKRIADEDVGKEREGEREWSGVA